MAFSVPSSVRESGNAYVDALLWGDSWDQSGARITYAFSDGYFPWIAEEKTAFSGALAAWAEVADLGFRRVAGTADADLLFHSVDLYDLGLDILAEQHGPDGARDQGVGRYNWQAFADWFGQLEPGGYAYAVIVHELGHALGLAHPHDRGGSSGLFPGVDEDRPEDRGADGQNTLLYSVMSYNDIGEGWAPDGEQAWGYVAGPMAFDIAAIQWIYGASGTTRSGDDAYLLPTANRAGTFYSCIWDAGGTDTIRQPGSGDAVIDLRAATLEGAHAGGYLSRVDGVLGGFTIAWGVVIERARGGSGDDRLTGNGSANLLSGGSGADLLRGSGGDDTLYGGPDSDSLNGGSGSDWVSYAGTGVALRADLDTGLIRVGNKDRDTLTGIEHLTGSSAGDSIGGSSGGNSLVGGGGNDRIAGEAGRDRLVGGSGADRPYGGTGSDRLSGGADGDRLYGDQSSDRLFGGLDDDRLDGGSANDRLDGGSGDDRLIGGDGDDRLSGGEGDDSVFGRDGDDRLAGGPGSDRLIGGSGNDKAVFDGAYEDYLVSIEDALIIVADREGEDGRDQLSGIQLLLFSDIVVTTADLGI